MGQGGMLQKGVETVMRGLTGKTDRIERRPVFRMAVVLGLLGLAMVAVLIQAWRYQGPASQFLAAKARRQTTSSDSLSGNRGSIFDSSGRRILAVTVRNSTVTSTGGAWQDDWLMIANSLAVILEMPVEEVFRKVWDGIGKAVVIKKDVGDVEAAAIRRLNLPSIVLISDEVRYYPLELIMGSVLGYLRPHESIRGKMVGELGVEQSYDELLSPQVRKFPVGRDKDRQGFYEGSVGEGWFLDGSDLHLTIDARLQMILDNAVATAVRDEDARGAMAVMLDPRTFKILAMSSYPFLDPNDYKNACAGSDHPDDGSNPCRNKVVSYAFEPGSIAKVLGLSAILESGQMNLGSSVNGGHGFCRVGGHDVRDVKGVGVVSLKEAVKVSSNCAMADGARHVQPSALHDVFVRFGIGGKTGIDLPNESSGTLRREWSHVDAQVGVYGYGYRTTLLTMATAVATIVNGGKKLSPRVVDRMESADGTVTHVPTTAPDQVVSESTARQVREALRAVVMDEGGTGSRARPQGYSAAGKTGTARIPTSKDQPRKYHCSFVGYAPAEEPAFVMAITLIDPRKRESPTGGQVAAPVFARVAEKVLPLFGHKPAIAEKTSNHRQGSVGTREGGDVQQEAGN